MKKRNIGIILKLICAFAALSCAFLLLLCSCINNGEKPDGGESASESDTEAKTDGESESETDAESEEVAAELVFLQNGNSDFKVVRSDDADGYYKVTASALFRKLNSTFNTFFEIKTDWINPTLPSPENDHEILFGKTNREESIEAIEDLDFNGYIIRITENKIVVVGSEPSCTNEALYYLFDNILCNEEYSTDGSIILPVGLEVRQELDVSASIDIAKALKEGKEVYADIEECFRDSGRGEYHVAQGVATDGKYAYSALRSVADDAGVERAVILKIDLETWTVVKESAPLPIDHANDMTYDPERNMLIVVNLKHNRLTLIDPDTLTISETVTLPFVTWGIGYVTNDRIAFLGNGLTITDGNFNTVSSTPLKAEPEFIGQGMDADEKYAYVPLSPRGVGDINIIQIYDIETGTYFGNVKIATGKESESIFHCGNDFYIQFNHGGTKIYKLTFYFPFE